MKDISLAYVLWACCFFGLFGIHRFYLNSWMTGFVYLFTFGLCGVGQVFDILLIPGLIAEANGTSSANNQNVGLFGFGNGMFTTAGTNYVSFNNAQPQYGNGGYSQYYVNDGNGGQQQPQSYVPPQQQQEGSDSEYVPPQQNSGFTMYINGQPVDLSNGGTIYLNDSGEAQYYTNDDDDDGPHFNNSAFDNMRRDEERRRLQDNIRRTNENINRVNEINRENTRRMNEQIRQSNENNRRINENNMRTHQQNMTRMNDNIRMHQNIHTQNMNRMHQQNMMNNINRMHRR